MCFIQSQPQKEELMREQRTEKIAGFYNCYNHCLIIWFIVCSVEGSAGVIPPLLQSNQSVLQSSQLCLHTQAVLTYESGSFSIQGQQQ